MQDRENTVVTKPRRVPWNKGKLIGAKPPLRPKHVWSIRTKIIWGDDIGFFNISAYNQGMMGYKTPNIDAIAQQGAIH